METAVTLKPRPEPTPDVTRREGVDVVMIGEDWTVAEVLRSLGELGDKMTIEIEDLNDGAHLVMTGSPESLLAAVTLLPVAGTDRDRVTRRLLPMTGFTQMDLRKFRSPANP